MSNLRDWNWVLIQFSYKLGIVLTLWPRPHERKKHTIFLKIARFLIKYTDFVKTQIFLIFCSVWLVCVLFIKCVFSSKKKMCVFLENRAIFFSRVDGGLRLQKKQMIYIIDPAPITCSEFLLKQNETIFLNFK